MLQISVKYNTHQSKKMTMWYRQNSLVRVYLIVRLYLIVRVYLIVSNI